MIEKEIERERELESEGKERALLASKLVNERNKMLLSACFPAVKTNMQTCRNV